MRRKYKQWWSTISTKRFPIYLNHWTHITTTNVEWKPQNCRLLSLVIKTHPFDNLIYNINTDIIKVYGKEVIRNRNSGMGKHCSNPTWVNSGWVCSSCYTSGSKQSIHTCAVLFPLQKITYFHNHEWISWTWALQLQGQWMSIIYWLLSRR